MYTSIYMEVLVLDGKSYVKASKAAKELGYATDYVGQLCRSGKVDSHLIGRTWYVNQEELGTHKVEKKRMSRVKAREYAKKTIEEHRQKNAKTRNVYTNIAIQYGTDEEPLIPKVEKHLVIKTEKPKRADTRVREEKGDDMVLENEGEEVIMSGALNVVDVTDGPIDDETVILHPSDVVISSDRNSEPRNKKTIEDKPKGINLEEIAHTPRKSFVERLEETHATLPSTDTEESIAVTTEVVTDEAEADISNVSEGHDITRTTSALIILIVYLIASIALTLVRTTSYVPNGMGSMDIHTTYEFHIKETINQILLKI